MVWQQSPSTEQGPAVGEQVGGGALGVQIPPVQLSVSGWQQSVSSTHAAVVSAHCEMPPALQVPLVALGYGNSQVRGTSWQQSFVTVQVAPSGWHAPTQVPLEQEAEQHCELLLQEDPIGEQGGPHVPELHVPKQHAGFAPPHAWPSREQSGPVLEEHAHPSSGMFWQVVPVQHGSTVGAAPTEQIEPAGMHCGGAQRSTPLASGVQGVPPQHWPLNWQIAPAGLQQSGSLGSQPVKQHVLPAVSTQFGSSTQPP